MASGWYTGSLRANCALSIRLKMMVSSNRIRVCSRGRQVGAMLTSFCAEWYARPGQTAQGSSAAGSQAAHERWAQLIFAASTHPMPCWRRLPAGCW